MAFGRLDLGLSESEFWRLTLRQFVALRDRWVERRNQEIDYQANTLNILASLASMYHKANFKKPNKEPKDFLIETNPGKPKQKHNQTDKEMLEAMKRITLAQGGKIKLIQGN